VARTPPGQKLQHIWQNSPVFEILLYSGAGEPLYETGSISFVTRRCIAVLSMANEAYGWVFRESFEVFWVLM
jgi:hypothetical protein